jgi:LysM repeat protein
VVSSTLKPITGGPGISSPSASSGDSGGTAAPAVDGATYKVVPGDTLSGIAAANGMSTSQIEALNPQIKDPDLIHPGQIVNLGSSGGATSSDSSQPEPAIVVGDRQQPSSPSGSAGSTIPHSSFGITGGSEAPGAINFPDKSSYPSIGSDVEKAADDLSTGAKAQGWVDGSGSGTPDVAKSVFEADSQTSTDPLKIDDKK